MPHSLRHSSRRQKSLESQRQARTSAKPTTQDVHKLRPRNSKAPRNVALTKAASPNFITQITANGTRGETRGPAGEIRVRTGTTAEKKKKETSPSVGRFYDNPLEIRVDLLQ